MDDSQWLEDLYERHAKRLVEEKIITHLKRPVGLTIGFVLSMLSMILVTNLLILRRLQ